MKNSFTKAINFVQISETFFVFYFAAVISALAVSYFFSAHQILLYNDARSHMDIARRVTDSLTPGVMQIGSVWLPLYQILMLPFVQNDFLWHTGLAGTIVSAFSYIAACYFIFQILKITTRSAFITWFGFFLFALNPNLLYLQSVPLDEVLAVASSAASLFFLLKWGKTDHIPELILAAFCAFMGSLTRYEIWFLLLSEVVFVFVCCLRNGEAGNKFKKAEGMGIMFIFLAFAGIFLWFVYNLLGWNDPLYFLHNPSAHLAQQHEFELNGLLPTKHHLLLSMYVLLTNIVENIGIVLTASMAVSLVLLLTLRDKLQNKIFYLMSLSPLGFLLLTLYFGITVLFTKFFPSPGTTDKIFNVRYGVITLIPAVIIVCTALSKLQHKINIRAIVYLLMFLLVIGDALFFFKTGTPATIQDGETGISAFGQANEIPMSKIVKENCGNGQTLISAGQDEIIMFESGFPMKSFIYEGSGSYWQKALANPKTMAECIVIEKNGFVEKGLSKNDVNWQENYHPIFNSDGNTLVYKLGIAPPNDQVANVITPEEVPTLETKIYSVKVNRGDSLSKLYRKIVNDYDQDTLSNLSTKEKLFMENYLVFNLPQIRLKTGDNFQISEVELKTALTEASQQ